MMMTAKAIITLLFLVLLAAPAVAQDQYDNYYDQDGGYAQQDNLYHDYAARQQEKGAVAAA